MAQKETVKTSKPLNTEAPSSGKLQRLGFIPAYSSLAYGYVSSAYDSAKGYIPAGLKPQLESAEKLYNKNVQPIVAKFTDGGQEILLVLDNRVDNAMKKGYSTYKQGADSPQVQGFAKNWNATGEQVVQQFKENINFVQEKGLAGTFEAAKKRAFAVVDDSFHFAQKVLGFAQERSQAVIDIGLKKSEQVHDSVVKQPFYKRAYDSSNNLLATAQDTQVYKETYKIVYPYVAPITDPAYEKIEPYYKNTVNYWKPVSAAA